MTKICENADIQATPCEGSVFSRTIKCTAGQPNTCLRNCSEKCPAYRMKSVAKPPVSAVLPSVISQQPPQRSVPYVPPPEVRTIPKPAATGGKGCGGCGKNISF